MVIMESRHDLKNNNRVFFTHITTFSSKTKRKRKNLNKNETKNENNLETTRRDDFKEVFSCQ